MLAQVTSDNFGFWWCLLLLIAFSAMALCSWLKYKKCECEEWIEFPNGYVKKNECECKGEEDD